MKREDLIKILSNNATTWIKDEILQDKAVIHVDDLINELLANINYTECSLKLKIKEAPTFEHWLLFNFEALSNGKFIDFSNGYTYRDKEVLKLKYNKIFKHSL